MGRGNRQVDAKQFLLQGNPGQRKFKVRPNFLELNHLSEDAEILKEISKLLSAQVFCMNCCREEKNCLCQPHLNKLETKEDFKVEDLNKIFGVKYLGMDVSFQTAKSPIIIPAGAEIVYDELKHAKHIGYEGEKTKRKTSSAKFVFDRRPSPIRQGFANNDETEIKLTWQTGAYTKSVKLADLDLVESGIVDAYRQYLRSSQ